MKLTGYEKEEVEFNFGQLMSLYYIAPCKINSYKIIEIKEESIVGEPIL